MEPSSISSALSPRGGSCGPTAPHNSLSSLWASTLKPPVLPNSPPGVLTSRFNTLGPYEFSAGGDQKRVSASLELEFYVVLSAQSRCWELNSGFLQKRPMLLKDPNF